MSQSSVRKVNYHAFLGDIVLRCMPISMTFAIFQHRPDSLDSNARCVWPIPHFNQIIHLSKIFIAFSTVIASQSRWRRWNQCTTLDKLLLIRFIEYALKHMVRGGKTTKWKIKDQINKNVWTKDARKRNNVEKSDHFRCPIPKRVKYELFYWA